MIPTSVSNGLIAFKAAVKAAAPVSSLTALQLASLVSQGRAVVDAIDAALEDAGPPLDAGDPTGFPGDFVGILNGLDTATGDQSTLSDMRGYVGRAVLNLAQGVS